MYNQKNLKTSTALTRNNLSPLVLFVGSGNRYFPVHTPEVLALTALPCTTFLASHTQSLDPN